MSRRIRYQYGSLRREKRKGGPDRWAFLWWETDARGAKRRRKKLVGTVAEYPTESLALAAAGALRLDINAGSPRSGWQPLSVADLISHYKEVELSFASKNADPEREKAFSTKQAYRIFLDRWIQPRWGGLRLGEVRTVAVEKWLTTLALPDGRRMAKGTKAKIRNIMHALFNHAIRYEWLSLNANPVTRVRQSAKRERIPDILEAREFQGLLEHLSGPARALAVLDVTTGLRRSEIIALKWEDIDFANLTIHVTRSIVQGVIGHCKTEASRKPVPLEPAVAEELWRWRQTALYGRPEDWVFASLRMKGKQPIWPDLVLRRQIQPAAVKAGITKRIGWHTFRHTYSTLLKANGEDVKVVQELLRHANMRITMDTYTQALSTAKRQAQTRVVRMILPGAKEENAARKPLTELFGAAPKCANSASD